VRYIDILGRKGCSRTALEYSKLLLSFDPENDPYGNLLRIDFFALRSGEYEFLINLVDNFCIEFYEEVKMSSLLIMPNLIYSCALAKFLYKSRGAEGFEFNKVNRKKEL
jgi:hypothetical protein